MKDFISFLIVLITGVFLGMLLTYKFMPRKENVYVYKDNVITKVDTITVYKYQKVYLKGKVDTVRITVGGIKLYRDTVFITPYAYADTSLENDRLKLGVKYYFQPNLFEIDYRLKDKVIEVNPKLSLGLGVGLSYYDKLYPSINLGIYYNLINFK